MHMRNTLFCLKRQIIGFVRNRFLYKLIGMVVYNVQTKARLLITKNSWFINGKNIFLYFIVPLRPCGLQFTKSNRIILFLSLLGTFSYIVLWV